jgi:hypothetical protein
MPSLQSAASVLATHTASANSFGHPEHGKACRLEGAKQGANSDKRRALPQQVDSGVRPRRYTVGDVLEDSLAPGVDGLSARTVTLYRGTIVKALNEKPGTVRLTELTAGNVQGALAAMAPQLSTRTLQIAHNVLVRVIRPAERDDLSACSACSSRCGAVGKNLSCPRSWPRSGRPRAGRPGRSCGLGRS